MKSNLSTFVVIVLGLSSHLKTYCQIYICEDLLQISAQSFTVLAVTFRPLSILSKFFHTSLQIFVVMRQRTEEHTLAWHIQCEVGVEINSFACGNSVVPVPIVEETLLSPLNYCLPLAIWISVEQAWRQLRRAGILKPWCGNETRGAIKTGCLACQKKDWEKL